MVGKALEQPDMSALQGWEEAGRMSRGVVLIRRERLHALCFALKYFNLTWIHIPL
jgi:hypothetical protein